jgi:hypothetical protein
LAAFLHPSSFGEAPPKAKKTHQIRVNPGKSDQNEIIGKMKMKQNNVRQKRGTKNATGRKMACSHLFASPGLQRG